MHVAKATGPNAAVRKYDLITALGAHALAQGQAVQKRIMRLLTLITARYNWQHDSLAVGQREIAALWSCDTRTVKREVAILKALGWLKVKRQGARGRVSEYGLDIERIFRDTQEAWALVGPDFVARLSAGDVREEDRKVVPLRPMATPTLPLSGEGGTEWDIARVALHTSDPQVCASWLSALVRESRAGGRLILRAPSRFHASYVSTHFSNRILAACADVDPGVTSIEVTYRQ